MFHQWPARITLHEMPSEETEQTPPFQSSASPRHVCGDERGDWGATLGLGVVAGDGARVQSSFVEKRPRCGPVLCARRALCPERMDGLSLLSWEWCAHGTTLPDKIMQLQVHNWCRDYKWNIAARPNGLDPPLFARLRRGA